QQRYDSRAHDIERPILPVGELYLPPERLREHLNQRLRVELVAKGTNEHAVDIGTQPAPMLPINRRGEAPAQELKDFVASYAGRVLIAADSAGRREALIEQLAQASLHPQVVASWPEFLSFDRHSRESGNPASGAGKKELDSSLRWNDELFITVAPL